VVGIVCVVLGLVGFLPILGFWMAPVGLLLIAMDLPSGRRWVERRIGLGRGTPLAPRSMDTGGPISTQPPRNPMSISNLEELFQEQIQDLYSGEAQILDALPDLIEAAHDTPLRRALQAHLEETRLQKTRLENIAREMAFDADGATCKGMKGILSEGEHLVKKDTEENGVRDAAIIAAAQRVEHYEMAGYGTARTLARMLGQDGVARTLEQTLGEEKAADLTLTEIAEDHVNQRALV
jgi:ferritin-like metal-binding protein YciE